MANLGAEGVSKVTVETVKQISEVEKRHEDIGTAAKKKESSGCDIVSEAVGSETLDLAGACILAGVLDLMFGHRSKVEMVT